MAKYLFIENYSKKGKIGISLETFNSLVLQSLGNVNGIDTSLSASKKKKKIILHKPVQTSISHGILHVLVTLDMEKSQNIQFVSKRVTEEISNTLVLTTEQVPFDVQVKVMSLY